MAKVKSVLVTKFGGYDSLSVMEYPLEELKDDLIEVEVHYCGVNFADLYTRQGLMPKQLPFVLGMECSGIIKNKGRLVSDEYKIGQRVICNNYNGGLFRTKVIVPASNCFLVPDDVDLKIAAAVFVNYLTAYFCVVKLGRLQPNEHFFINTCAGGVGIAATQLAKLTENVKVYGTTSLEKADKAKEIGVDYVLDYNTYKEKVKEICPNGLDFIIDNQAGDNYIENQKLLNSFGRLIVIGANNILKDENQLIDSLQSLLSTFSMSQLLMTNTSIGGLHVGLVIEKHHELAQNALNEIFKLYKDKKIKPVIDSVWEFNDVVNAMKRLQERKNVGKVLLHVKSDNN